MDVWCKKNPIIFPASNSSQNITILNFSKRWLYAQINQRFHAYKAVNKNRILVN
jgi:hypothetical protein